MDLALGIRQERHLMRQRGAGARPINGNFGFVFKAGPIQLSTPPESQEPHHPTTGHLDRVNSQAEDKETTQQQKQLPPPDASRIVDAFVHDKPVTSPLNIEPLKHEEQTHVLALPKVKRKPQKKRKALFTKKKPAASKTRTAANLPLIHPDVVTDEPEHAPNATVEEMEQHAPNATVEETKQRAVEDDDELSFDKDLAAPVLKKTVKGKTRKMLDLDVHESSKSKSVEDVFVFKRRKVNTPIHGSTSGASKSPVTTSSLCMGRASASEAEPEAKESIVTATPSPIDHISFGSKAKGERNAGNVVVDQDLDIDRSRILSILEPDLSIVADTGEVEKIDHVKSKRKRGVVSKSVTSDLAERLPPKSESGSVEEATRKSPVRKNKKAAIDTIDAEKEKILENPHTKNAAKRVKRNAPVVGVQADSLVPETLASDRADLVPIQIESKKPSKRGRKVEKTVASDDEVPDTKSPEEALVPTKKRTRQARKAIDPESHSQTTTENPSECLAVSSAKLPKESRKELNEDDIPPVSLKPKRGKKAIIESTPSTIGDSGTVVQQDPVATTLIPAKKRPAVKPRRGKKTEEFPPSDVPTTEERVNSEPTTIPVSRKAPRVTNAQSRKTTKLVSDTLEAQETPTLDLTRVQETAASSDPIPATKPRRGRKAIADEITAEHFRVKEEEATALEPTQNTKVAAMPAAGPKSRKGKKITQTPPEPITTKPKRQRKVLSVQDINTSSPRKEPSTLVVEGKSVLPPGLGREGGHGQGNEEVSALTGKRPKSAKASGKQPDTATKAGGKTTTRISKRVESVAYQDLDRERRGMDDANDDALFAPMTLAALQPSGRSHVLASKPRRGKSVAKIPAAAALDRFKNEGGDGDLSDVFDGIAAIAAGQRG